VQTFNVRAKCTVSAGNHGKTQCSDAMDAIDGSMPNASDFRLPMLQG